MTERNIFIPFIKTTYTFFLSRQQQHYNNGNFNLNNNQNRSRFNNNNYEAGVERGSLHGTPVRTSSNSRHTANLLASLDKSILQIRDWLTLLEGMIKKDKVDLSDRSNIIHILERQKVSTKYFYSSLKK